MHKFDPCYYMNQHQINNYCNDIDTQKTTKCYRRWVVMHVLPKIFKLQVNFGDYVFHEAAKLGRRMNLRGYRAARFYGDASFYQNTEIRIRLADFHTYVLTGMTGLFVFNDVGRVWLEEESSGRWHHGYGGGFWVAPFDMAVIGIAYAHSREDGMVTLQVSYQF